jgi:hypothetical protein
LKKGQTVPEGEEEDGLAEAIMMRFGRNGANGAVINIDIEKSAAATTRSLIISYGQRYPVFFILIQNTLLIVVEAIWKKNLLLRY